ncbi:hypothetical protein [Paenibacillus sp.]|uniref:hypothetical protein n=1 Tax=Paenibacillus sp. TaxID=58172 RepID=UPI002D3DD0E6|nr:hypothetical protein [Paenibacillus sp.]HZG85378.1 hypothetical protein [Paenibacillus sp.]
MWKKIASLFLAFSLVFAVAAPLIEHADAKPRYRSPSRSYTPEAPAAPKRTDNVDNGATNRTGTTTPGTAPRTGAGFGAGGLMRGLMLGGLAGLMFGGLLSGLGAFGSILGLLINGLALALLFVFIRNMYRKYKKYSRPGGDYR